jgi:hypothetical protein
MVAGLEAGAVSEVVVDCENAGRAAAIRAAADNTRGFLRYMSRYNDPPPGILGRIFKNLCPSLR